MIHQFWEQARPAVINVCKMVDLARKNGIVSEFSPGVLLQVLCLFILTIFGIIMDEIHNACSILVWNYSAYS